MSRSGVAGDSAASAQRTQPFPSHLLLIIAFIAVSCCLTHGVAAAQGGGEGAPAQQSPLGSMLPLFVAFIAIMYFFMIRPNQKRERERREMLNSLAKNDRVVTNGGICGTIVGLSDKTVVLLVSEEPRVKMEFVRAAVAQVAARGEDKGGAA